ncbi:MAG: MobA/MobL family protein, partial [Acetobacteraceae bacterium]|nr:MobA/MobL family protein [Acetobacteraceae bacterium]
TRANGRLATELELALPHDLTAAQRKELLTDYVTHIVERYGVAADVAIHEPGDGKDHRNIHAHVLITHRELDADGFGDVSNARTVTKKVKGVEKDVTIYGIAANPEDVKAIRSEWEQHVNLAYERAGLDIRIDHRSHADRGIEQEPTKHLGPAATGMERRGEASDRGDINRDIEERNAALRERAALEIAATKAQAELAAARQLVEMERAAEIARRAEQAIQEARRAAQGRTDDTRPDRAGIDRQAEQAMQAAHAATKGRTEEIRAEPAAPIFDREAAEAAWQKQIIDAAAAQAEQEARAAAKGRTDDMRPDRAAEIDRQAEQAEQEARVAARGRTDDIRAPDALRSHEVQPEPATEIRTPSPLDLDLELGEAVDSGMKAAGGLSASFARAIETVLSGIFSFFDSGPKLTPDQAERQARSNAEQQEERARQEAEAEQAAAQDRVLAEQLRQAAREREEEERFRRIMRDAAREDRGYERERERER